MGRVSHSKSDLLLQLKCLRTALQTDDVARGIQQEDDIESTQKGGVER